MGTLKLKVGDVARQRLPAPIEGRVFKINIDEVGGIIQYGVEFKGEDGEVHSRFFAEDDVEKIEPADGADAAPK